MYDQIPDHMMESLRRYIEHGVPTGDFLRAVISNDLRQACERADDTNAPIIRAYVAYLYNHAPIRCWGSPQHYSEWIEMFAAQRAQKAAS